MVSVSATASNSSNALIVTFPTVAFDESLSVARRSVVNASETLNDASVALHTGPAQAASQSQEPFELHEPWTHTTSSQGSVDLTTHSRSQPSASSSPSSGELSSSSSRRQLPGSPAAFAAAIARRRRRLPGTILTTAMRAGSMLSTDAMLRTKRFSFTIFPPLGS